MITLTRANKNSYSPQNVKPEHKTSGLKLSSQLKMDKVNFKGYDYLKYDRAKYKEKLYDLLKAIKDEGQRFKYVENNEEVTTFRKFWSFKTTDIANREIANSRTDVIIHSIRHRFHL